MQCKDFAQQNIKTDVAAKIKKITRRHGMKPQDISELTAQVSLGNN